MRTINRILAVTAAVALAGITGCSAQSDPSTSTTTATPPAAASAAWEAFITIENIGYDVPASVRPGARVAVTNTDSALHTLTAKDKGGFDMEVPAGAAVTFEVPQVPGNYGIICRFHPQMTVTLAAK